MPAPLKSPKTGKFELPGYDVAFSHANLYSHRTAMYNAGYRFVMGYVSPNSSKNISSAEMAGYRAAGFGVGIVWESSAGRPLLGSSAGASDGANAHSQANALGYPSYAPVFFAMDQSTTSSNYAAISAYASAFNAANSRPIGMYGGYDVINDLVTPGTGTINYGWQTGAWSGGRLSTKAAIYQRVPIGNHAGWPVPAGVASDSFDEDIVLLNIPLYGWEGTTGTLPPGPTAQPAPALPPAAPAEPTVADKTPPGPDAFYLAPTNCTTHVRQS
jgi:hypothetical protein